MGTRADFYVGRGVDAEWVGSCAWHGYPESIPESLRKATDEPQFRREVETFSVGRNDWTNAECGWPWPWEDSRLTDYSYAFDSGKVFASNFGNPWFDADKPQDDNYEELEDDSKVDFPNMAERKNVTLGKRSGLIILGGDR